MQHGAENLAFQVSQTLDLDQRGQDEVAMQRLGTPGSGAIGAIGQRLPHRPAQRAHRGDVALDVVAGLRIDDRADVGGQLSWVAQPLLGHGTQQHLDHPVGGLALHTQHPQGRATLAGAVEGRADDVLHHLLGQRRRVDHQAILAAGLGD